MLKKKSEFTLLGIPLLWHMNCVPISQLGWDSNRRPLDQDSLGLCTTKENAKTSLSESVLIKKKSDVSNICNASLQFNFL